MKLTKSAAFLLAGAIIGASITAGTVAVEAGAGSTATSAPTWYACLSSKGALSKVGATSPTCTGTSSAISWNSFSLPIGDSYVNGYFIGPNANLNNADLTGANLSDGDLKGADLTGANLSGAILSGANLAGVSSGSIAGVPASLPTGWSLIGGYLIGPGANLRNALLQGADLTSANLSGASVSGANFSGADLSGANIEGVDLSGIDLSYANFTGENLIGFNLSNSNLAGSNLSEVSLASANLDGVSSGMITGIPTALPANWLLVNGYLIGPRSNLTDAQLVAANLSNADLVEANLSGANLYQATLPIWNVNLSGVIWNNTECPNGFSSAAYSPQTCQNT